MLDNIRLKQIIRGVGEVLGNQVKAYAVLDSVLDHGIVVNIKGDFFTPEDWKKDVSPYK